MEKRKQEVIHKLSFDINTSAVIIYSSRECVRAKVGRRRSSESTNLWINTSIKEPIEETGGRALRSPIKGVYIQFLSGNGGSARGRGKRRQ